jgi:hypothetical protein
MGELRPLTRSVVFHAVRETTDATCWAHEPHTPPAPAHVVVDYLNRLGRWIRVEVCTSCLMEFLATVDGSDVVVWTRSAAADLAEPMPLGERPSAPVLRLADGPVLRVIEGRTA